MTTKAQILQILANEKPLLAARFGVRSLSLFGSAARDELKDSSDIDLLVEFEGPSTARAYFGTQFYLEDLLGRPVDLVTQRALRAALSPMIEREAILV
jgi:uncharacterized protein